MAKREVSAGLIGVVVGSVIGIGAVLYTQDHSLNAQVASYSYRSDLVEPETVRNISARRSLRDRLKYRSRAEVNTDTPRPRYPDAKEEVVEEEVALDCATIAVLRDAVVPALPEKPGFLLVNKMISDIFDAHTMKCGEYEEVVEEESTMPAAEEVEEEVVTPRVNNHCEKYARGTVRRSTCEVLERDGEVYIDSQTKGYEVE